MDLTVLGYILYLLISVALTIWVARTLSRNGRIFLADVMQGNEKLADAVNHLLVVGFYLVNLGFVALYLKVADPIADARELFEALSVKLGTVLLVLGLLHLVNVFVLNKIRRRGVMEREQVPPVAPQGWTPPAAPTQWGPPAPGPAKG
jgi:carbon starvation protein CstA